MAPYLFYVVKQDEVQHTKPILAQEGAFSRSLYHNTIYVQKRNLMELLKLLTVAFDVLRSRSRSHSPSYSRRHPRGRHPDDMHRSKPTAPKIEYITEFGGSGIGGSETKLEGFSPPSSPPSHADVLNRSEHSTFYSCKDTLDNVYSAADFPHFVTRGKLLWFRIDQA